MKILLLSLALHCMSLHIKSNENNLELQMLEGKWYVNMTNFPMWLKGDKINPEFNYTITERKGKQVLLDKVVYTKKGKRKTITGYDTPRNEQNTSFTWRGRGLLGLLKSEWKIVHADPSLEWMIIYFEKTLFTPEGYDVISKRKLLSTELQKNIEDVLSKLPGAPDLILLPIEKSE